VKTPASKGVPISASKTSLRLIDGLRGVSYPRAPLLLNGARVDVFENPMYREFFDGLKRSGLGTFPSGGVEGLNMRADSAALDFHGLQHRRRREAAPLYFAKISRQNHSPTPVANTGRQDQSLM